MRRKPQMYTGIFDHYVRIPTTESPAMGIQIRDISNSDGEIVTNFLQAKQTKALAEFGVLKKGTIIKFEAVSSWYIGGGRGYILTDSRGFNRIAKLGVANKKEEQDRNRKLQPQKGNRRLVGRYCFFTDKFTEDRMDLEKYKIKTSACDWAIVNSIVNTLKERDKFDCRYTGFGQAGFYFHTQDADDLLHQLQALPDKQLKPCREQLVEIAKRSARRAIKRTAHLPVRDQLSKNAHESVRFYMRSDFDVSKIKSTIEWLTAAFKSDSGTEKKSDIVELVRAALKFSIDSADSLDAIKEELDAQGNDVKELIPVWPGE